jgi:hypothetical protein
MWGGEDWGTVKISMLGHLSLFWGMWGGEDWGLNSGVCIAFSKKKEKQLTFTLPLLSKIHVPQIFLDSSGKQHT